jgi:hypothetical protein
MRCRRQYSSIGGFLTFFMYLWPTYYTLEIRMHILNLPQFKADLQILYVFQISFCGILYLAGYYIFITSHKKI